MEVDVRPTRFHRLLKRDLGSVPHWMCSNGSLSVAGLLPGVVIAIGSGACSALALIIGFWVIPLIIAFILLVSWVWHETAELKRVERKCRARIRRHECSYCGVKLNEDVVTSLSCLSCESELNKPAMFDV